MAESIKLRETPLMRIDRFKSEYGLDEKVSKQIVNTSMKLADIFEKIAKATDAETARSWTSGTISANWKVFEEKADEKGDELVGIISEFHDGKITDTECSTHQSTHDRKIRRRSIRRFGRSRSAD